MLKPVTTDSQPMKPDSQIHVVRLLSVSRETIFDGRGAPYTDVSFLVHAQRSALVVLIDQARAAPVTPSLRAAEIAIGANFRFDDCISFPTAAELRLTLAKRYGALVAQWAHVSAAPGEDSALAETGAQLMALAREDRLAQGSNFAWSGSAWLPDFAAVADVLSARSGPPVVYTVTAHCRDSGVAAQFVHWMRWEHGRDLLTVTGVTNFSTLYADEKTVRNEYLFTDQGALDTYLAGAAAVLRAKGAERFSAADVRFERQVLRLAGGYGRRAAGDFRTFAPPPLKDNRGETK